MHPEERRRVSGIPWVISLARLGNRVGTFSGPAVSIYAYRVGRGQSPWTHQRAIGMEPAY